MGTSEFSLGCLQALIDSKHEVVGVFTREDKPKNRGMALSMPPVKELALTHNLPVFQPKGFKKAEVVEQFKSLEPDICVVVSYGRILPKSVLEYPKYGCINVHASILPKYRGSSPIQWAVINGEKVTGITVMKTALGVDTGDILLQKEVEILPEETAGELFDRLAVLGGEAVCEAVDLIACGKAEFTPQDSAKATHCGMITKADGKMDFSRTARELDCFVRGMTPWPSAYFAIDGKRIKVFDVEPASFRGAEGTVLAADKENGLVIGCKDGSVRVRILQPEGKKRMNDTDFLLGNKITVGAVTE